MSTAPTRRELRKNLKELRTILEDRPMDLDARMRVARTFRLLNDTKEAINHYQQVARYLSLAGKPIMAIMVLKELLQVDPAHEEPLLFIAKLYARTGHKMGVDVGRVAKPIEGELPDRLALPDGMPQQVPALWNAIRPRPAEDMIRVSTADDLEVEEIMDAEAFLIDDTDIVDISPYELQTNPQTEHSNDSVTVEERRKEGNPKISLTSASVSGEKLEQDFSAHFNKVGVPQVGQHILPQVPLFSSLTPDALVHLIEGIQYRRIPKGTVIFKEGEPGNSFMVIAEGRALVSCRQQDQDVPVSELGPRDFAGVFGLMAMQNRQATLTAQTDLDLLEISRGVIDDLLHVHPKMRSILADFYKERLLMNLLTSLPVFSELDLQAREKLVAEFKTLEMEEDEDVFYQGADYNGLWVVLQGKVNLLEECAETDDMTLRGSLGPGDYVGSFARADDAEADIGARTEVPSIVAMLTHKSIREMLVAYPNTRATRKVFQTQGLMISDHVFAGNAKVPGNLVQINEIFERHSEG